MSPSNNVEMCLYYYSRLCLETSPIPLFLLRPRGTNEAEGQRDDPKQRPDPGWLQKSDPAWVRFVL
jgi:hypothetical protein